MADVTDRSTITTERLLLQPLRVEDADHMVEVLADPALHEFTGGEPATLGHLRDRYASWVRGSGSDAEQWLNWTVRRVVDGAPVGAMQATIEIVDSVPQASVAWTIGSTWQRQGYASEATIGLLQWLDRQGIRSVLANIHPGHEASAKVATNAGLRPTDDVVDGEVVWRLSADGNQSV
ncbi:MAG: GNAT family N-acetyltransferase [Ilumatobacteraceae bacterium]